MKTIILLDLILWGDYGHRNMNLIHNSLLPKYEFRSALIAIKTGLCTEI